MAQRWKRQENVPFPSIWHKFTGKKEVNGVLPKFWVQDIPEEYYQSAIAMMCDYFINEEPLCRYSNAKADPQFFEDMVLLWTECLKDKVALICFMENPDPKGKPIVAGLNMTAISYKGDKKKTEFKSEISKRIIGALNHVTNAKDPFETLKIDEYLTAMGLLVLPEFRGQNLGLQILKAREPLCKTLGLKATVTSFTSIISQKLAAKCGFKVLCEMTHKEIESQNPKISFPGIENHTKSLKNMYMLFE
ncbi:uncharacterized protein LOC108733683 [Agrilus planipennis]|uniref:Uncharacterized protein LOC108733683 n=1 Tax=Agrilus planipennis TaxID=224129 RepID=A0A1W4W8S3_AGRPL|nr:uncharacterized protein LOC108733683 [Agrilus planipennis]